MRISKKLLATTGLVIAEIAGANASVRGEQQEQQVLGSQGRYRRERQSPMVRVPEADNGRAEIDRAGAGGASIPTGARRSTDQRRQQQMRVSPMTRDGDTPTRDEAAPRPSPIGAVTQPADDSAAPPPTEQTVQPQQGRPARQSPMRRATGEGAPGAPENPAPPAPPSDAGPTPARGSAERAPPTRQAAPERKPPEAADIRRATTAETTPGRAGGIESQVARIEEVGRQDLHRPPQPRDGASATGEPVPARNGPPPPAAGRSRTVVRRVESTAPGREDPGRMSVVEELLREEAAAATRTAAKLEQQLREASEAAEKTIAGLEQQLREAREAAGRTKAWLEKQLSDTTEAARRTKADLERSLAETREALEAIRGEKTELEKRLSDAAAAAQRTKAGLEETLGETATALREAQIRNGQLWRSLLVYDDVLAANAPNVELGDDDELKAEFMAQALAELRMKFGYREMPEGAAEDVDPDGTIAAGNARADKAMEGLKDDALAAIKKAAEEAEREKAAETAARVARDDSGGMGDDERDPEAADEAKPAEAEAVAWPEAVE